MPAMLRRYLPAGVRGGRVSAIGTWTISTRQRNPSACSAAICHLATGLDAHATMPAIMSRPPSRALVSLSLAAVLGALGAPLVLVSSRRAAILGGLVAIAAAEALLATSGGVGVSPARAALGLLLMLALLAWKVL